jgi:hypothetical protein
MRFKVVLVLSLLFILAAGKAAGPVDLNPGSFDSQFRAIISPYTFNFASWEFKTLLGEVKDNRFSPLSSSRQDVEDVKSYFDALGRESELKTELQSLEAATAVAGAAQKQAELKQVEDRLNSLRPLVEKTLASQVSQAFADQGIYSPIANQLKNSFPPVNFKLEKPLYVMVVSPRDRIDRIEDVTLVQDITPQQIETLEAKVDSLNVSSLIIPIGGLGATFPSFVEDGGDLKWTLETVAHEWMHQYLAFTPLGFRYVLDLLGLSSSPDIDTLNETVANIVGKEIGDRVFAEYYSTSQIEPATPPPPDPNAFNFDAAMRTIRLTVDADLAKGQVLEAERYMQDQRDLLKSKGYYIRKLNQAYFAFYGSYADSPTSVDPIGTELASLRQQSPSLRDFVNSASTITSKAGLEKLLR